MMIYKKLFSYTSLIFALTFFSSKAFSQLTLPNPILSGFYPDPAICKVGSDYYVVNSTFSFFPGLPVLHSKDLKNWRQIGSVITRPSQMDFMGETVSRGLFAPAINYHNGLFYVTCTDIDNGGNFVVTAKNPAGPWSDPVYIREVRGIDPSLFFDDNKAYIIYNSNPPDNKSLYSGHRTLRMYEFDAVNLKVIGEETLLVNGGVDISKKPIWIEGPHIYKREGWYYLMAAEGGTAVNHSEVVLRSKNPRGPYIAYEKNPILTQRHLDPNRKNPITSTGHADLVEGPDGKTYAIFIAVRPYEGDYYNTGRETFIAPVKWIDGWPVINPDNEEVLYEYPVSWKEHKFKNSIPLNGNFDYKFDFKDSLNSQFLFLRTNKADWYSLQTRKNYLTMNLSPETIMGAANPSFLGKRQQHLTSEAIVEMDFSAKQDNEKAGLTIFQNETHFYYICKSVKNGKEVIQLFKSNPKTKEMDLIEETSFNEPVKKVYLKINSNKDKYSFSYATKKNDWQTLGKDLDGKFLSTRVAGGFVGALYGMYTTSLGVKSTNAAQFKWFNYSGNDETFK
ncbi:glycoside hydrolase family 43 protein [Pedobacter cryophilus]|nr:glycoside hydrolase family 43 protein [Pedobacter cryophilus]